MREYNVALSMDVTVQQEAYEETRKNGCLTINNQQMGEKKT